MGFYKHVRQQFQEHYASKSAASKNRLVAWRKQGTVERVEAPTNVARARAVGFKAKKEFIVARVSVRKGKRRRRQPDQGRKPAKKVKFVPPQLGLQKIAEEKAVSRFSNSKAIGSYLVGEDGVNKYFEVILRTGGRK